MLASLSMCTMSCLRAKSCLGMLMTGAMIAPVGVTSPSLFIEALYASATDEARESASHASLPMTRSRLW